MNLKSIVLSGTAERQYINHKLVKWLSPAVLDYLEKEFFSGRQMFVDWIGVHTEFGLSTSPEECFLLLCSLLLSKLSDKTSLKSNLEELLKLHLKKLSFPNLAYLLHLYSNAKIHRPFSSIELNSVIKDNLPQRNNTILPNSRNYLSNPINQLSLLRGKFTEPCRRSKTLYSLLMEFSDDENSPAAEASLKNLLECSFSLLFDFDKSYLPTVESMMSLVMDRTGSLQRNDVLIAVKCLVLLKLRGSSMFASNLNDHLKTLDSHLRNFDKDLSSGLVISVGRYLKAANDVDLNQFPNIKKSLNDSQAKLIRHKTSSRSEDVVAKALNILQVPIQARNTSVLSDVDIDILATGKRIIEVNGLYHYCSSYRPDSIWKYVDSSTLNDVSHIFSGDDLVKLTMLCREGFTVLAVDLRILNDGASDPQVIAEELKSCCQLVGKKV